MHSRKTLFSLAAAAIIMLAPMLTGAAFAGNSSHPGNNGGGNGGCGVGQQTNGCGGQQGPAGPQGPQGVPGKDGRDGKDGAPGAQGPKGDKGDTGATGATGAAGKDGTNGTNGKDGADGKDGVAGAAGTAGKDGAEGAAGKPGNGVTYVGTVDGVTQDQLSKATANLQQQIDNNDKRANAGISAGVAMASIPQAVERGSVVVGMGAGTYRGESGVAIGASACDATCDTIGKVSVGLTSRGDAALGMGVVWRWK